MMQWSLLLSLLYLGLRPSTAQFVFFGPQFGGFQTPPAQAQPRPAAPAAPQPPQRFGAIRPAPVRLPAQPSAPALTAERFSETFFRPTKKLHHPEKNALPEEKPEDVKFVQILTEKPPTVESSRSRGASRANSVVLPARVSQTTARPVPSTTTATTTTPTPTTTTVTTTTIATTTTATTTTTTTARPTTTTRQPATTARPTTTTTTVRPTAPSTTTAAPVTPLRIKSFVVNQFGQAVSRPSTTPAPAPVRRPTAAATTTA